MINEASVYKTINDKNYIKTKYLLSQFLNYIYNTLKRENILGTSKKFTMISEAIFFMLSKNLPLETWNDYSIMLETAYKENAEFPKFLVNNFHKLLHFHNKCPVLANHSNEKTLFGIVEKLLKKCTDINDEQSGPEDMDVEESNEKLENVLKIIGLPMVKYGIIDKLPSMEDVGGPFFISNVNQFAVQIDIDIEVIKRIATKIGLPTDSENTVSNLLRDCEKFILNILQNLNIENIKTLEEKLNSLLKAVGSSSLISFDESVKQLIKANESLQNVLELRPEMECEVGTIIIQQFQSYNVQYILTDNSNKYSFYVNSLQTYARCYVMELNKQFCSSKEEFEICKTTPNAFKSKLDTYIEFFGQKSTLKDLIQFKNEILSNVNASNENECIQVLKSLLEVCKESSLTAVYTETNTLLKLYGDNIGLGGFKNELQLFLSKFGNGGNLGHVLLTVLEILINIGSDKSVFECLKILKNLISHCGNVKTIQEIEVAVGNVKDVYRRRLKDEKFSINNLSTDLESFINQGNTEKFSYIPGDTNNQKLELIHEQLTEPLREISPTLKYSDITSFFRQLLDDTKLTLDRPTLNEIIKKNKNYEKIEQENQTFKIEFTKQVEQLTECTKSLDDYKLKLDISNKTNIDYAKTIEMFKKECEEYKDIKREYDLVVQNLEKLKSEHDILQNTYKLIQQQNFELQSKRGPLVGIVKPDMKPEVKKRKLSESSRDDENLKD